MKLLYKGRSLKQLRIQGCILFVIMILCIHYVYDPLDMYKINCEQTDCFQFNYKSPLSEYASWSSIPPEQKFTSKFVWNKMSLCPSLPNYDRTIIIIVNSARVNFDRRHLQRTTLGSIKTYKGWKILALNFLLGQKEPNEDPLIAETLQKEFDLHRDLTMGDFTDTYRNLTLKSIMGFEWIIEFCPDAQVVLKMDDDVVVNIFEMIKLLNSNPSYYRHSWNIYGDAKYEHRPSRYSGDKWFVSKKDYPGRLYPTYCSGFAQLTTVNVIERILIEMRNFKTRISMDDIFLTGIVPESFNRRMNKEVIRRVHINGSWEFPGSPESVKELREWYSNLEDNLVENLEGGIAIFFIIEHGENYAKDFVHVWNKIKILNKIV